MYKLDSLAAIMAQVVHFAWDDYGPYDELPEPNLRTVAYQIACFAAQHTTEGQHGVESEEALLGLRIRENISYEDRLAAATKFVATLT